MSELTTLSLVRARRDPTRPAVDGMITKADIGKGSADDAAGWADVLAAIVPTVVIAGYSALLSFLLAAIKETTHKAIEEVVRGLPANLSQEKISERIAAEVVPNHFLEIRWAMIVFFALVVFVWVGRGYSSQGSARRNSAVEAGVATGAFVVWALGMVGTPIPLYIQDPVLSVFAPFAILIVGGIVLALFSEQLRQKLPPT